MLNDGRGWTEGKKKKKRLFGTESWSCRTRVGGFHSDPVFGVDTQISQDVNCLSVGPFWISVLVVTVFIKRFFLHFDK